METSLRVGRRLSGRALVVVLALAATPCAMPAAAGTAACQTKLGPVGAPFVDCSLGQVLNVVPPGENGTYDLSAFLRAQAGLGFPAHTSDQEAPYADLLDVAPNVKAADLTRFYKDEGFLTDLAQAERVETFPLRPGTVIVRDAKFGVAHVYGVTRADTEFGSGYASAEDRLFEMDVLRHVGRAQLTSFVGPTASNVAMDCSVAAAAGYSESELQQQVDDFPARHPTPIVIGGIATTEGQQIVDDAQAYVDGVNAYIAEALVDPTKMPAEYPLLQVPLLPWKTTDIVATATLVQAIFATGGGNEVGSALLYGALVARWGATKGAAIWRDLRAQDDPEAPTSIATRFAYEAVPSAAVLDPRSRALPLAPPVDAHCTTSPATLPGQLGVAGVVVDLTPLLDALRAGVPRGSNELIVDAGHSVGGHPIAVFGPQTSYYVPELLHEVDLHGPGLHARGVSFTGTEVFVELGRGADYAWSATSAGADIVDERLEKLCNPDGSPATLASTAYVFNGVCTPMYERTDVQIAKPTADAVGPPAVLTIQVERTVHGPVVGRTTAIDPATGAVVPVAVSSQRSTFGDELGAAPAFLEWNDPDVVHGPTDFQRGAGRETGTFNWTYVDAHDVAYYMAGRLPVRDPRIDPNFPTWGTGEWEWRGFVPGDLSAADVHPRASTAARTRGIVNAKLVDGFFTNWNNKPAPGFSAADGNFGYGPVHRVQSLSARLRAILGTRRATPVDVVNAMEDAGSVDLDGAQLVPALAAVLAGAPLSSAQQQVVTILQSWAADPFWGGSVTGAHRRDRAHTGSYEQGNAVAIMDKLYPRLAHAIFDPWLDADGFARLQAVMGLNDLPRAQGSAYDGGWEGYLQRALRQAANPSIANGYSQVYCGGDGHGGGGTLASCQAAVQAALQATIDRLTSLYGTSDPTAWTCARTNDTGGRAAGTAQSDDVRCNPALDDIQFSAVGVGTVPSMPWVNRPTFQQVVQYTAQRPSP